MDATTNALAKTLNDDSHTRVRVCPFSPSLSTVDGDGDGDGDGDSDSYCMQLVGHQPVCGFLAGGDPMRQCPRLQAPGTT